MERTVVFGRRSSRLGSEERGGVWCWRIEVRDGVFLGNGNVFELACRLGVSMCVYYLCLGLGPVSIQKLWGGEASWKYKHWYHIHPND